MKLVTLLVSLLLLAAVSLGAVLEIDADEDWDGGYPFSPDRDDRSPTYWAEVISPTQAFNTNQNHMNMTYYSKWDSDLQQKRLYVTLQLFVEQPDVGQDVYLYFGLKHTKEAEWDIARCHVTYDGEVNLKYRQYDVTDHHSSVVPYFGGLDEDLSTDKYQNWAVHQRGSNSTCPGNFQKCEFNCMIARDFTTFDVDDLDFELARNVKLNAAYHVYDGLVSIQSGGNEYD